MTRLSFGRQHYHWRLYPHMQIACLRQWREISKYQPTGARQLVWRIQHVAPCSFQSYGYHRTVLQWERSKDGAYFILFALHFFLFSPFPSFSALVAWRGSWNQRFCKKREEEGRVVFVFFGPLTPSKNIIPPMMRYVKACLIWLYHRSLVLL